MGVGSAVIGSGSHLLAKVDSASGIHEAFMK